MDARENLDPLVALIDQSQPVLRSQSDSSAEIRSWASSLAALTEDLQTHDASVGSTMQRAPQIEEMRQLFDRIKPTVPIIAANLASTGEVLLTYQPAVEQLLVLLPPGVAMLQGIMVPGFNVKQKYKAITMDFNLNLNLPPPCATGFLPASQRRTPAALDFPDRVPGRCTAGYPRTRC